MPLLIVAIVIVSSGICYNVAKRKHRSMAGWVALAALIGPLAIPLVYLVKPLKV